MKRRLLLVEDSSIMRRMISALLEEEGYEVALAVDGKDGLAKVREVSPELVVSDYEMPELDGPGFCRALKADPELRAIPVVMLTTLGAVESKVIGLDAGADDYIQKPQSPQDVQEIFARIRAQLRIADLRKELAERNSQLEAAQARLQLELNLARKVQFGLMPKAPKSRGVLKMAVRYKPANALGGDVYDIVRLGGKRLGILMVDISGHGVNAALLSGMVNTLASPSIHGDQEPGQVLAELDTAAEQYFPEGYFCTAFYFRIDEATGAFDYAGVGHPPALIVGPNGSRPLDSEPGLLGIGLAAGTTTRAEQLQPGESLLLYTDGLPDAMDPADRPFNTDRIVGVLEANRGEEPSTILDRIEKAVADYVEPGQPHDDINLVLVQNPPAA
ncbi:MAG: SpoIIE family protein phosphatase [Isosphaeraceae bacterium]